MKTDERAELQKFLPRLYFFLRALRDAGWVSCVATEGSIRIKQPSMQGKPLCPIQAIVMAQTGQVLEDEDMRTDLIICQHLGISIAVLYRIKDIIDGMLLNVFEEEIFDNIRDALGMAATPLKSEPKQHIKKVLLLIRVPTSAGPN
jgi:hypothetical protein